MPRRRQPPKDFRNLEGMRAALYCRVSHISKKGRDADEQRRAVDEKSVDDQEREGKAWAEREGVTLVVEPFRDEGLSASAFSAKGRGRAARPGFDDMLKLVEAGGVDVVWVWAIDRSNRDLRVFTEIRDLFQDHQVALSVSGRLHDPNIYDDWMMLGFTSQFGERYSHELSKNVRRGQKSAAGKGEPHGGIPFGYRRRRADVRPEGIPDEHVWIDRRTKQFVWQEPNLWDGDGRAVEDTPAAIVREIYRRIVAGEAISKIARDLNDRKVNLPTGRAPTAQSGWRAGRVSRIALNPAYIGRRVYQHDWQSGGGYATAHKSAVDKAAKWPALVDERTYWTVHRTLTDPARKQARPAAGKSLLSCLVECAKCGGPICAGWTSRNGQRYHVYSCLNRRCAAIKLETLDEYVEEVMIRYLSRADVAAELTQADDTAAVEQALADAQQARQELERLDADLAAGLVSARSHTIDERRLQEVIREADQRARDAAIPAPLRGRVGEQAETAWRNAPLEVNRELIRTLAEIKLRPTGLSGGEARWYPVPLDERVEWRWLIGPDLYSDGSATTGRRAAPRLRILTSETRALRTLAQDGRLPLPELNGRLGMGEGSLERVVRRMRRRGWVSSELAPHVKPVRLVEVAQRAGVSLGTASRAINDLSGPAPATRRAVLEAADQLGYPGTKGRGGHTATIAITEAGRRVLEQAG